MLKKIIISFLIPAFLLQVAGCYSENIITKKELNKNENDKIRVITNKGKEYDGESNYWFVKSDSLVLNSYNFSERKISQQKIPLTSIKEVYADQYDGGKTVLFLSSLVIAAITIAMLTAKGGTGLNFPGGTF